MKYRYMENLTLRRVFSPWLFCALAALPAQAQQVGQLLWEDNFDSLNTQHWNVIEGDGCQHGADLCGWGNQELQYYRAENVSIEPVPGESGNSALVLEARNESVENSAFTSGKLDSQNAVSVHYGMIETRIRVPNLDTGLWPAFWLLGTSTATWPENGEIDMMEMGHRQSAIDEFHPGTNMNSFTGSNAIFYADAACASDNPTCAAMSAWQTDNAYVAQTPLNDRFVTYRLYWTDQSLRFTVVDNGVEYDMYDSPIAITEESEEFRQPFYLLMNMAVGGNFTDVQENHQVTAPMPAKMYVDYVRVYELDGQGDVTLGNSSQPETGTFGVFTDSTPTSNTLEAGESSDIHIWNTNSLTGGSEAPYEGDNVIAWDYTAPGEWFGGGVQARQARDMSNFADGHLSFRIKVPADVSFRIGITDTYTNEHYIDFPAYEDKYGLVRNGDWSQVRIPVADLRGDLIALQSLQYLFAITSDDPLPNSGFSLALDDIVWEGGGATYEGPHGATQVGADAVDFYVNSSDWADVHYTVNGGGQLNVRMEQDADRNRYQVSGLASGDTLSYHFTYWDTDAAVVTDPATLVVDGQPSGDADSDGDGVADSSDQCPGTPPGTSVDANGCEVMSNNDSDGDGVMDADDQCPNTPPGVTVDAGGCEVTGGSDSDGDGVADADDQCPGTSQGTAVDSVGCALPDEPSGDVVALYGPETELEPVIQYDRGDALVTRFSDRARDRHAKENHFQAYDHYLSFYWEDRTAAIEIIDYVAKGGEGIRMNVRTLNKLDDLEAENRWFYTGTNTLAEFCGNGVMETNDNRNYWKEDNWNCREGRPIQIGDKMEFEISQFLDSATLPRGRANYYGTTYLYIVGEGLVPWDVTDKTVFTAGDYLQRDSVPIPERARLGGDTSLHVQMTAEPDGHFQQMATNLGYENGQPFVLGRRVHHTSFVDGVHDENPENGVFSRMVGKAGDHYINERCSGCHERNGRASVVDVGEPLDRWVFKIGDGHGNADPLRGHILQPRNDGSVEGEGDVTIDHWSEADGRRSPNYQFATGTPDAFSARLAPNLNGLGLLEAIPETAILALADPADADGDGISGRANRITDPETGETRLGRFGYKAGTMSIRHQVAQAFNGDMGVMTSVLPNPDCGPQQTDCGTSSSALNDGDLDHLVKYISLLGVRPQRDYDEPAVLNGEALFDQTGCAGCHTPSHQTSSHHPLAELRDQTIHPYTDMLLHDMGPGLADNLGEGTATGAEWRTAPLWGLSLSACVTGGVEGNRGWDAFGLDGYEQCTPDANFLHDGRARTIEEAIRWHGGEADASRQAYQSLSAGQKADLLAFLNSL